MFGGTTKIPDRNQDDPDYIRNKKEKNALDRARQLERAINFQDFMQSNTNLNDARNKAALTPDPNDPLAPLPPAPGVQDTAMPNPNESNQMLRRIMRGTK